MLKFRKKTEERKLKTLMFFSISDEEKALEKAYRKLNAEYEEVYKAISVSDDLMELHVIVNALVTDKDFNKICKILDKNRILYQELYKKESFCVKGLV